jgi:CheY-like chemotaxis protein
MVAAACVRGDRARLTQIFTNLISNASKYSDRGASIEVGVEQEAAHAIIRVIDSGAGIDSQMVGRVFDLFVQADKSLDRRESGLGVGLTIVKRLVALHGGHVEARSAGLGRGSEFVVRLPLSGASIGSAASSSGSTAVEMKALEARVLIVDDNEPIAYTLGRLLQIEGFEIRVVHSGQAALKELELYEARIVLLDIGLPDIDGYMVAQLIRERYPDRPLRLAAVTGYGTASDRELALTSGFDAHLTKPVAPEQLIKVMTSGLSPAAVVHALPSS